MKNDASFASLLDAVSPQQPDTLTALTNMQPTVQVAANTLVPHPWTNAGQLKLWDVMTPDGAIAGSLMKNNAPFSKWKVLVPGNDPLEFDTKRDALKHLGISE